MSSAAKVLSSNSSRTALERYLGLTWSKLQSQTLWTGPGRKQSCCSNPRRKQKNLLTQKLIQPTCVPVRHHNYDGEVYSKTNISLLTEEDDSQTYITAFSPHGFLLNSGFRVLGPCIFFPRAVLSWDVASAAKLTPESLSLFHVLEPKPDLLLIGKGDWDAEYNPEIVMFLKSKNINVEVLPTEKACSTFNFLNYEGRVVVGAMIPPSHVDMREDFLIPEGSYTPAQREITEDEAQIQRLVDGMSLKEMSVEVAKKLTSKTKGRNSSHEEQRESSKRTPQDKDKES